MTTINDITDLVQILQERPEWLQVIRGLVIGEELAQVPQQLAALEQRLADFIEFVKQNSETVNRRLEALEERQARTEERQERLEERQARMEERQDILEQRLADFIEFVKQNTETVNRRLEALEERQARTEERQERLEERQARTEERQARMEERQDILEQRLAEFIEFVKQNTETVNRRLEALEERQARMEERQTRMEEVTTAILRDMATLKGFHTHSAALQATRRIARTQNCRQIRLLNDDELYDLVENNDTADIVPGEQRSFVAADIVIEAERRDTGDTCYIAVEVSFTAHENDIRRAARNADFLTRFTGNAAIPVVAAAQVDPKVQADFDQGLVQWYPVSQADIEPE